MCKYLLPYKSKSFPWSWLFVTLIVLPLAAYSWLVKQIHLLTKCLLSLEGIQQKRIQTNVHTYSIYTVQISHPLKLTKCIIADSLGSPLKMMVTLNIYFEVNYQDNTNLDDEVLTDNIVYRVAFRSLLEHGQNYRAALVINMIFRTGTIRLRRHTQLAVLCQIFRTLAIFPYGKLYVLEVVLKELIVHR